MATRWEVTKAVRASRLAAPARLVMFVLADVAEVGTAEIPERFTPSLSVLAHETGLNESTVKRHLKDLEAAGWVERSRPTIEAARLRSERTRYRLTVPGCTESPDQGAEDAQGGAREAQPRAQREPSPGRTQRPNKEEVRSSPDLLLIKSDRSSSPGAPKARRGQRIPDDFAVTPEMNAWAKEHVPQLAGMRETEKFINYWRAKSGAGATKLDWAATWRNWMITAAERLPNSRASPGNSLAVRGQPSRPSTTDQRIADAQALKAKFGGTP